MKKSKNKKKNFLKRLLGAVGPGVITGLSDDDPSGIGTYSIAGARFGLQQLWISPFQLPMMIAIQEMCGRLGMVTGRGLSANIKKVFSVKILYGLVLLLLFANTLNIGANISAMAASVGLVVGGSIFFWALVITLITISLEIFVSYRVYASILKWLCFSFIAYIVVAFEVSPNWGLVLRSAVIPHVEFSREFLLTMVAFLGTSISPYLFFWQASEENEEQVAEGKMREIGAEVHGVTGKSIRRMKIDTYIGMALSQIITFFIVVTTWATLHQNGIIDIDSASEAAMALKPLAGSNASLLFMVGLVGAGLIGIPVLAGSAAYAVAETFGWKEGLYRKLKEAKLFYGVIVLATVVGMLINFVGINPMKALLYSAVVNGVVAVPLILMIILLTNNKKLMGDKTNGWLSNVLGWITFFVMALAAIAMFVYW